MSWFDTSGLASLAKTALKEAQKQIDKALDIKEEELATENARKVMPISKTAPSTPQDGSLKNSSINPALTSSLWGSFSGSFFDNPVVDDVSTVTKPPSSANKNENAIIEETTNHPQIKKRDKNTGTSEIHSRLSIVSIESERNSSESVEILSTATTPGSCATSPGQLSGSTMLGSESVEVLGSVETPTDSDFVLSPETAPSITISEKSGIYSPESVEIIPEDIIDEEVSVEDDSMSYNTVSETTTAVTVVEPKPDAPITIAPTKTGLHLSLGVSNASSEELITTNFRLSSSQSNNQRNSEDIIDLERPVITAGEKSDNDIVKDCSSGQFSLLLEDALLDKSIENFEMQTQLSDSTQSFEDVHTNLIASYNPEMVRNSSPNSSGDSKSDLVKVSMDQTSGHTSADEVETATSSDIEIISSPNGCDSSSANSAYRASPLKSEGNGTKCMHQSGLLEQVSSSRMKGHHRELSEVSIQSNVSDESGQSDTERLLRRISELSDILELRENKLVELGRQNAELQDRNSEVLAQLEAKQKRTADNLDITNVTEEYTQRLSALEKKFQQSIRERDHLRKQLDTALNDLSERISREEFDKEITEKDYLVKELRNEGEKLSKQVLQHSNIIKKLRAKEKESDTILKKQKEQISELTEESERLKKSLQAKDEVERSQIEAVHKLSSDKRRLDKENGQLRSQFEDLQQKLETTQTSLEAAKHELNEKKNAHTELIKITDQLNKIEAEKELNDNENVHIFKQLSDLREKLRQSETSNTNREQKLRQENQDLLRRLEESEIRGEEQTQNITLTTIPLMKQIDSLQQTLNGRTLVWERQEKQLIDKLDEAQRKLQQFNNNKSTANDELIHLNLINKTLDEQLKMSKIKNDEMEILLKNKLIEYELKEHEYKCEINNLEKKLNDNNDIVEKFRLNVNELETQLRIERETVDNEKNRIVNLLNDQRSIAVMGLQERQQEHQENQQENILHRQQDRRSSRESSPTLSLGRISLAESLGSALWHGDELDCISNSYYGGSSLQASQGTNLLSNIISSGGGGGTTMLETLQSTLKQRDGELIQLQWEIQHLQIERNCLTTELSNLTNELDNLKEKLKVYENYEVKFENLQKQYDAILQMYGEKVEETQELKLDLQDIKDMYKGQINELLNQQKKAIQEEQQSQQEEQEEL